MLRAAFSDNGLKNIRQADECGYETVGGPLIDVLRRTYLLDDAVIHNGNTVGNRQGFLLVMGNIYRCNPDLLLDVFNGITHFDPQFCVQIG